MKLLITFLIFTFYIPLSHGQCLSGDCKNGYGKYDYSYAVYEGAFKNGEPHGTGIMNYGGGEKYMGDFAEGKENGAGLMYRKDGSYETVQYNNGRLFKKEKINIVGGNIIVEGCLSGNCKDNFSTLIFPDGNKYIGGFKEYLPHGNGKYIFTSGNIAEGIYENGVIITGKLTYSTGEVFTGTFNKNGTPNSGKYRLSDGDEVNLADNKTTTIRNLNQERLQKNASTLAAHNKLYKPCPLCGGTGGKETNSSWKTSRKIYTGTIYDEYEIKTVTGPATFSQCIRCWGKGEVKR